MLPEKFYLILPKKPQNTDTDGWARAYYDQFSDDNLCYLYEGLEKNTELPEEVRKWHMEFIALILFKRQALK